MFIPLSDENPLRAIPFQYVTIALILANVAVFAFSAVADSPAIVASFAVIPTELFYVDILGGNAPGGGQAIAVPESTTLLTYMFFHADIFHLLGNMLFLWVFGDNMEDQMGHVGFLAFYLSAGIAAALAQVASAPDSIVPMVGASGAIAGVMGGYLLLFPKARVDVALILIIVFRVIPVPAWIVLSAWFGLQLVQGSMTPTDQGGVAYWAHAGGFAAGLALTFPLWRKRGGPVFWRRTEGHPPHPETRYRTIRTTIPSVRRRR